jgi:broad specificity phosphatase PhoE
MKRLFVIRHAESELNVAGLFAGHTETPLTANGRQQALEAGLKIKQDYPKIDLIVSSPLSRTYDTAKIIAQQIGYPGTNIMLSDLLIERNFGIIEGTSYDEFWKTHVHEDIDKLVGAETVEQLHQRAIKALNYLKSQSANNILVVTHGAMARALNRVVQNLPHSNQYLDAQQLKFRLKNAEIVEFDIK